MLYWYIVQLSFYVCGVFIKYMMCGRYHVWPLVGRVQRCCTKLFHAFGRDYFHRCIAHKKRKTRSTSCSR